MGFDGGLKSGRKVGKEYPALRISLKRSSQEVVAGGWWRLREGRVRAIDQ